MEKLALIRHAFTADPDTGRVFVKERPRSDFSSDGHHARHVRDKAGREAPATIVSKHGHRQLRVRLQGASRHVLAHHVVWCLARGDIPVGFDVDHVNGDGADNRLCNLRLATRSQNTFNSRRRKPGLKGAYRSGKRWMSTIRTEGRQVSLGTFDTEREAHEAWRAAAIERDRKFFNPGYSIFD